MSRATVCNLLLLFVAAVGFVAAGRPASAADSIPITDEQDPVASRWIHFMTRSEPADSLVLRVSLGYAPNRCCGEAFVVIEQMPWPPPLIYRIDGIDDDADADDQPIDPHPWWQGAVTIAGSYLNQRRREMPPPEAVLAEPGQIRMRAGAIGDHWQRPFRFEAWLSPYEFAIDDSRARFVIRRVAPQSYELVAINHLPPEPVDIEQLREEIRARMVKEIDGESGTAEH